MAAFPFTLRQLQYFDAIAGEGSLAAAAKRYRVSASALTLAIDDLEHHLRLQLLIRRKGKGVILTPAGARLLLQARRVLQYAESLSEDAWQAASTLNGRFAIGCFSTLAPFFLPALMELFRDRHPELDLEFAEAATPELVEMLLQGRIDAALVYDADVSAQLAFDPVSEIRPYVMVCEAHRLATRSRVRLGELISEPLILLDVHPSRPNTERLFRALDLKPRVGHMTGNFELARCLVARGLGYGVLFQRPASRVSYDGNALVTLEIDDAIPRSFVGVVRPAGAPRTARHTALVKHLRTVHSLTQI